mgnify:CR=1 FL=1
MTITNIECIEDLVELCALLTKQGMTYTANVSSMEIHLTGGY